MCASAPPLYIEGRTWRTHTHAAIKIQKKGAAIMADRDIEAVADRAAAPPPDVRCVVCHELIDPAAVINPEGPDFRTHPACDLR